MSICRKKYSFILSICSHIFFRSKNILILFFIFTFNFYGQIDANALFVLPKATTAEINGISTPNEGSMVYNSDDGFIYKYTSSAWELINDGSETNIVAGDNIVITGTGTASDPYSITSIPATLTQNADGTYTFSNGVDPDVIITPGSSGSTPIVSQSNATGSCTNQFETNETKDVVIQGDFFDGSASVTIAGQTVNSVTVNSVNQITANVTSGTTPGDYDIQVTTTAGTGTLPNGFSIKTALVTYNYAAGDIVLSNQMSYVTGTLDRTAGAGWNQQGYSTVYQINLGAEGHLNFTSGPNNRYRMIGLNSDPATNASYASIDYAIYLVSNGRVYVFENGANRGYKTTYVAGDQFEVNVSCEGVVSYLKNGSTFYTSTVSPSGALYLDTSFYNSLANISNISITY
ncbi:hypothetical protein [Aquimarina sediminis]|uniref:hypothetical protein n=1 Tax=Aquimarina sediminis TaxID=2070536 RepID=UPI000CA05953|nr:hypothetical protein [Aquimarina sediminis]